MAPSVGPRQEEDAEDEVVQIAGIAFSKWV
jgi:hypothetical protein